MALGRPRKSDLRDTRQSILLAALDLYSQHGYDATSMRQLAGCVGIRESAIYVHFKSKEHILQTLLDTYGPAREVPAFVNLKITGDSDHLKDSIITITDTMIDHWCEPEEIKFHRLLMSECLRSSSTFRNEAKKITDNLRIQVRQFFERLVENSTMQKLGIDFIEAEFIGPMNFMRQNVLLMNEVPEHRELLKSFARKHIDFLFTSLLRSEQ